jgi:hypothetical protein
MSSVLGASRSEPSGLSAMRWLPIVFGLLVHVRADVHRPMESLLDVGRTMRTVPSSSQWSPGWSGGGETCCWRFRTTPGLGLGIPADRGSLVLYVIGRSQDFSQPDAFSQIPLVLGLLLALQGKRAFRALLFPICFLTLSVSLPVQRWMSC